MRGCRRTGGTRVPVTIRSYHVYFPYESTRASSWARASFLAGDSHQPPSSPQATQGLRSPELTTEPVSVCAFSCRCRRERICSALVCVPLLPLLPQGWGDQARTSSPAGTGRWGIGRGRGASLTRPGPRQPCPAETASCGWCTPASPSAGRGPPARKDTFTCTRGLAAAWRKREPRPDRGPAGEGGGRPWHRHKVQPQRPGTQGVSQGGEGWSEIRWTKRRPQTRFSSPASCGEAPGRGADAQPWGRRGRGRDVPRSELPRWVARGAPSYAVGLCQLQIPHSPTHSQVHCKKRPLPPGMASPRPLREETPMPVTLSGLFSLPLPPFLRPAPLSARTRPCPAT